MISSTFLGFVDAQNNIDDPVALWPRITRDFEGEATRPVRFCSGEYAQHRAGSDRLTSYIFYTTLYVPSGMKFLQQLTREPSEPTRQE